MKERFCECLIILSFSRIFWRFFAILVQLQEICNHNKMRWRCWFRIFLLIQLAHVPRHFTFGFSLGLFHGSTRVCAYICLIRNIRTSNFSDGVLSLSVDSTQITLRIVYKWSRKKGYFVQIVYHIRFHETFTSSMQTKMWRYQVYSYCSIGNI